MNDLKQKIIKNPLLTIVSIVVVTASTTAGFIHWLEGKSVSLIKEKHDIEMKKLNNKLELLSKEKNSIVRKADGKVYYIDTKQMTINKENILNLSSDYKAFCDGDFYLKEPSEEWSKKDISMQDLLFQAFDLNASQKKEITDSFVKETPIYTKKNITAWENDHNILEVEIKDNLQKILGISKMYLKPYVAIIKINKSILDEGLITTSTRKSIEAFPMIYTDYVNNLYKDDLSSFILIPMLLRSHTISFLGNGKYELISSEKKNDVVYTKTITNFWSRKHYSQVSFKEELIFIDKSDGSGFLILTGIPYLKQVDLASREVEKWIQELVENIRFPI